MGWSIASFKDRKEAEEFRIPFDGESILKQLP